MMRALWTGASGMKAQQTNVDTIANNLANVNTVGYKSQSTQFKSLLYQTLRTETTTANGEDKPTTAQVGLGARVASTNTDYTQGTRPMPARQRFASVVPAFSQYVARIMAPIIPEAVISPGHWITWATVYLRPPKDRKSLIIRAIRLCSQMEHLVIVFLLVPMEQLRIKRQMAPIFQQDNRWHCISSTIQKVWKNQETACLKRHRHPAWL